MVLAKYMKIHELDTDLETYLKRHPSFLRLWIPATKPEMAVPQRQS